MTPAQASEIVRGRLQLPTSAKLRIQKNIPNALQIFSERIATDDNKRHIILTPKTVTGTPTLGVLDLADLIETTGIMVDKLHLGNIYNDPIRTFTDSNVDLTNNVIDLPNNRLEYDTLVNFVTTGVLPSPLLADADYYIASDDRDGSTFGIFTGTTRTRVTLTSTGMGTQTILTPDVPAAQPMSMLINPEITSYPVAWMDADTDKFWWLIGSILYVFDGTGQPLTNVLQFNVPHTVSLSEFAESPALQSLQDEFIDTLIELTAQAEAKRENG
jgi:hypothetical protein